MAISTPSSNGRTLRSERNNCGSNPCGVTKNMNVKIIPIEPKYKKENGVFVVDIDNVKIPFEVREKSLVYIPPKEKGGNHKHPRTEAFLGIGEGLKIIWKDENGKMIEKNMNSEGELLLFVIPADTPHVIINNSKNQFGILIEFADDIQHDVERVEL